jgi:hypothetical protein
VIEKAGGIRIGNAKYNGSQRRRYPHTDKVALKHSQGRFTVLPFQSVAGALHHRCRPRFGALIGTW